jgi:hemerythrin-like metal-binding protein
MYLQWTQDLSVNNHQIDSEHQRWIEILNNFYDGLQSGKPKEKLEELVSAMIDYTKYHFASEEKHMKAMGYPDVDKHIDLHQQYVNQIEGYLEKFKSKKLILSLEVTNFLKSWLIEHIKGADQDYMRFEAMAN